jgi:hypothetical protein
MISERLDDPHAAVTFSGKMLTPRQVAERASRLLDRPRPVASIPRSRAVLARTYDLFPRLERASMKPLLAVGRLKARRLKRRIEAGGSPPG